MTNLVEPVAETVDSRSEAPAVWEDGAVLTYAELWERAGRFARGLSERDIGPGERVGIYLPNVTEYVIAFYGTLRAGCVVVPMNPQYRRREIEHLLADSGTRAVVTLEANVPEVEAVRADTDVDHVVSVGGDGATPFEAFLEEEPLPTVDRADDDTAAQPYTSGTTGTPKGVLLSHRNLAWTTQVNVDVPDLGPDDRLLGVLPLFHIYGMVVVMNGALYAGSTFYAMPEWTAEDALELFETEGITVFFGVPAMFNDLVNHPEVDDESLSSIRFANSGGDSIPLDVLERFESLAETELYEGYGLTETSPTSHAGRPGERRKGSVGRPLPGVESKVVDEDFETVEPVAEGPVDEDAVDLDEITGEIVIAGPNVMQGYYDLPEANEAAFTEEDGTRWLHTGDVGYWDEDGYFFVVDREKHVIVSGGYNVYPREIEELLYEHEAIAEAAVVGLPDERRGETVAAYVVPTPNSSLTADEVREYCLDQLAAYKHPREVAIVEELPRTATGKVQKFRIREESA